MNKIKTKKTFILNFLKLYNMVWQVALPFLKKNKRLKHGFNHRINPDHHTPQDIWIQAASAGEAYLAVTLIQTLEPSKKLNILVTSTTTQGIDILKKNLSEKTMSSHIDLTIDWFLFDKPSLIKKAVGRIAPQVMVLLETELWPALLYYLKQNHIPCLVINGRMSEKSHKTYKRTSFLWKHLEPTAVLAISKQDASRYQSVFQQSQVSTMPNIKFETITDNTIDPSVQASLSTIIDPDTPLTILASIREEEETDALRIIQELINDFPDQIIAVFPRHMHRIQSWAERLKQAGLGFHFRTRLNNRAKPSSIILWDQFGELKNAYSLASTVFVGGSLKPLGGQNFIEPAVQGAFTVTGPFNDDFAWTGEQIFSQQIVRRETGWQSVAQTLISALKIPPSKEMLRKKATTYMHANTGGTNQACQAILRYLR